MDIDFSYASQASKKCFITEEKLVYWCVIDKPIKIYLLMTDQQMEITLFPHNGISNNT